MTSTAIIRRDDDVDTKNVIDAVFESFDDRMRGFGQSEITNPTTNPTAAPSISPVAVGFIALGSAVAGFVVGFAICDTLSRG